MSNPNAEDPNVKKLEEVLSGVLPCRMMNAFHPGIVPMHRVILDAKTDAEKTHNFMILQEVLDTLKIPKIIEINKLIEGELHDIKEFVEWMHTYSTEAFQVDRNVQRDPNNGQLDDIMAEERLAGNVRDSPYLRKKAKRIKFAMILWRFFLAAFHFHIVVVLVEEKQDYRVALATAVLTLIAAMIGLYFRF